MTYIILAGLLLFMSILFYNLFKREIISPTVITCLIFFLSVLGAFLGTANGLWNHVSKLQWKTVQYIILGIFSFGIGEFLSRKLRRNSRNKKANVENSKIIRIDLLKNLIVLLFIILTMVLLYMNLKAITNAKSLPEIISRYKSSNVLYNESALEEGVIINSIVLNMLRFCEITCVVYIYIVIKNLFLKDKVKSNIINILNILLIILLSITVGGRAILLKFFAAGIMIWAILYTRIKRLSVRKFFKLGLAIVMFFIPLCYFILPFLGNQTTIDMPNYVSFYLGSEIPAFDIFLENPTTYSEHFGQETLQGLQMFLSKFGIIDSWTAYQREWVYFTPTLYTNTFTEFKPFIQDFGINGVIVCPMIFGFIFSKLYLAAKEKMNCRYLIFFSFFTSLLIDQARIEVFFRSFLSTRTVIYLCSLLFVTWFLFGKRKIKGGEV